MGRIAVLFKTFFQSYGEWFETELEEDEEITIECNTMEEAEEIANQDMYGCRGQFVEVYINEEYYRDYEVY